jgi:hypothetical protein
VAVSIIVKAPEAVVFSDISCSNYAQKINIHVIFSYSFFLYNVIFSSFMKASSWACDCGTHYSVTQIFQKSPPLRQKATWHHHGPIQSSINLNHFIYMQSCSSHYTMCSVHEVIKPKCSIGDLKVCDKVSVLSWDCFIRTVSTVCVRIIHGISETGCLSLFR